MQRRLAAIMAADVVNYSKLMGADQAGTLEALRALRNELFEPVVTGHSGTVIKRMGDGWIVEFASVSDAANCACEIQQGLAGHPVIQLRIGVHTGEVVFEEEDLFGDGVNVAARLEELAQPGQVLISDNAHQSLDGKTGQQFAGGEAQELKNIARPVGVWRWPAASAAVVGNAQASAEAAPAVPDKPSIAVLPFDNMSGDKEQEYFADGITEDIITALSKFRWLLVIARNSSFSFKGQSFDIRDVAQSLGVRYVLEGSIRRAGNRVRITGQLIDASDGSHIWADKFDGVLDDIFELQDQVTLDVIGAIEPSLRQAEIDRLRIKPTDDLQAYELFLRAQSHFHLVTDADNQETIRLLSQAITMDPGYAIASGLLAWCYVQRAVQNWALEDGDVPRAIALAKQVLESDRADAMALAYAAHVTMIYKKPLHPLMVMALAYAAHVTMMFGNDNVRAAEAFQRSLAENPNSALAHALCAGNFAAMMQSEQALDHAEQALRLSPKDTYRYGFNFGRAIPLLLLERFDEAADAAMASVIDRGSFLMSRYILIAALVSKGDLPGARKAVEDLRALAPQVSLRMISESAPFFQTAAAQKFNQAWRNAGIPD